MFPVSWLQLQVSWLWPAVEVQISELPSTVMCYRKTCRKIIWLRLQLIELCVSSSTCATILQNYSVFSFFQNLNKHIWNAITAIFLKNKVSPCLQHKARHGHMAADKWRSEVKHEIHLDPKRPVLHSSDLAVLGCIQVDAELSEMF